MHLGHWVQRIKVKHCQGADADRAHILVVYRAEEHVGLLRGWRSPLKSATSNGRVHSSSLAVTRRLTAHEKGVRVALKDTGHRKEPTTEMKKLLRNLDRHL